MTAHENPKWIEIHALLILDYIIQIACIMCVWAIFLLLLNWLRHRKREESREGKEYSMKHASHTHRHNMANFIYLEIAFDFHFHERKRIPVMDDTR